MSIDEILVPTFFLFLSLFVFIFADKLYDFFLKQQHEYYRLVKGDDAKPPKFLVAGRKMSIAVGRVISLLMFLFSLFMFWVFFLSGWQ